ncbi:copper chaperone PCu(A)C [Aestuariivirga sp. YIM B02566]|uniref:Copper chaperone PCu(A)C n=1 Tax=Taklimakanibacter albus TaxID=2800327 RepID=A0ACC5R3Z4_9HYPH|nr:copper chaperone PCu(A)C [Aestuariivirga sp. YIM B02566]MBK1867330.1 copper chaperone PCu(A)C [Aestuariivirga sp. YIM B02566]
MKFVREIIVAVALTVAAFTSSVAHAHDYKVGSLVINHPWTPEPPMGAKVAAGFLKITNEGSADDRLVSVTTEIAGNAQVHGMKVENGVMSMFEIAGGLVIPAGQTVELKSKSNHVMFMDLKQRPTKDTRFKATLTFEKAGPVAVEFKVEPMGAGHEHEGM